MLSLEAVPRLEAASRQFFQVLVLVLVLVVKVLVLVLVLRVTVSVLVLVLAHTVLLTSRGFDNLTTASGKVQYNLALHPHALLGSPYVMAGVLCIYPTQFRLHLPGRVASSYGRLTSPLTSSYLNSGLNLECVHSRTLAQLPGTIFHKIFTASQNSPSSRNT